MNQKTKMWYIHKVDSGKPLNIKLPERNGKDDIFHNFIDMKIFQIGKSTETGSKLVVAGSGAVGKITGTDQLMGTGFF